MSYNFELKRLVSISVAKTSFTNHDKTISEFRGKMKNFGCHDHTQGHTRLSPCIINIHEERSENNRVMTQVCVKYSTPHRTSVISRRHSTEGLRPNDRAYAISANHQWSLIQRYNSRSTTQCPNSTGMKHPRLRQRCMHLMTNIHDIEQLQSDSRRRDGKHFEQK